MRLGKVFLKTPTGLATVRVLVPETATEKSLGLRSQVDPLADDEGMLFDFSENGGSADITTEEMRIAIDLVCILDDRVSIVMPDSRAERFTFLQVDYVLELCAGWCEQYGVNEGTRVIVDV